jgi:hypothetical protein
LRRCWGEPELVISAKAGVFQLAAISLGRHSGESRLRRQDAEANIGLADGPQGERQGWREYTQ